MNVPIVIIHTGYRDYLKYNLEITGKNNKVYIIGDESLASLGELKNITYIDIEKYRSRPWIIKCKDSFVNYSSNSFFGEWLCFERVLILKDFMLELQLESVFHSDSDNVIIRDINSYPFKKQVAYCIVKNHHKHRMSNSIHCGLLNKDFCDKFVVLYTELYVTKSKYYLINEKIKYHTDKNGKYINGGVCDMTLYYILASEKIIDVQNLLEPNQGYVFMNNINNGEGYESKEQYRMKDGVLQLDFSSNKCEIFDEKENNKYQLFNIHFQGRGKKFLNDKFKTSLFSKNIV